MEKEYTHGPMDVNMKENGEMVGLTVKEHFITQMAIFMKVNLKMTKLVDMEFTIIKLGLGIKGNGKMISKKGMVVKNGKMVHFTKDTLKKAKRMAKESINGQMEAAILVTGKKI